MEQPLIHSTFLLAPDIWWGFRVKTAYMRSNHKKESEINQNQNQTEHRTQNTEGNTSLPKAQ